MISFGELQDDVLRALRRTNSEEDRETVKRYANRFYFSICRAIPIKELRRRVEIDLSSADYSDGMWLKANMADILGVWDVDDEFPYVHRDRTTIDSKEYAYRYYDYIPTDGVLASGDDAEVPKGSSSFTADSLTDDHTGEYIKFGSEPGFYLLTAAKSFSPVYYGKKLEGADYVIRPMGTRKIVCIDSENDEITDRSINVDYWEFPPPMYNDSDVPLLPSTRALELMVMKDAMAIIGKRSLTANTFDRDIEAAMSELRKLCPPPSAPLKARDGTNTIFSLDREIFESR